MMIAEPGRYAANAPLRPLQAPQSRRHEEDDHDHDDGFTDEPDYPDYYDHEGYTEEDEVEVEDDDEFYDLEKDNLRSKRHCWRICRIVVILPILLLTTLLVAGFVMMGQSETNSSKTYLRYSTVPGYFLQDEEGTDPKKFDYVSSDFGLIDRTYDTDAEFDPEGHKPKWERFENAVRQLNEKADDHTQYKVLYMGRHGQGFHNVAERYYGTDAWDCYWSLLDGNDTMTWDDAHLTEVGEEQARTANGAWAKQIKNKIPFPESFYVSPLNRCLQTAYITFHDLDKETVKLFRPVVKELVRETLGIHTCDRRSSKAAITSEYPEYHIEPGFSEADPLWDADLRESDTARNARLKEFLDDVCTHDPRHFISFTCHSGAITSLLEVLGHRKFPLDTGAMIPVLVKVERVQGDPPPMEIDPPSTAPDCKGDPLKAGGGIVRASVVEVSTPVA